METGKVFTDLHVPEQRMRALDPDKVDVLAKSMKENGLQQPITVWATGPDLTECHLVAGLHRLEAAKKLGWEDIDCIFTDLSETRRKMWEIAENLHRVDLTAEQRHEHIRRYAELLKQVAEEEAAEVSLQNATQPKSGPQGGRPKGITTKIAEEFGLDRSTVHRALNPAPPKPKEAMSDDDVIGQQFARLVGAWNAAGPEARQQFREWVDQPVIDGSRLSVVGE